MYFIWNTDHETTWVLSVESKTVFLCSPNPEERYFMWRYFNSRGAYFVSIVHTQNTAAQLWASFRLKNRSRKTI